MSIHFVAVVVAGILVAGMAVPAAAQARRAAPAAVIPASVQGVWFKGDADGRSQCAAYKRAAKGSDTDEIWRSLILANVITSRRMHAVAEYGEGNVYEVQRVAGDAKIGWTVTSRLVLDGDEADAQTMRFQLKPVGKDRLQINFVERGRVTSTETDFRCAPLSRFLLSQHR